MSYASYSARDYRIMARILADVRDLLSQHRAWSETLEPHQIVSLVEGAMVRMFEEDNDRFKKDLFLEAARVKLVGVRQTIPEE